MKPTKETIPAARPKAPSSQERATLTSGKSIAAPAPGIIYGVTTKPNQMPRKPNPASSRKKTTKLTIRAVEYCFMGKPPSIRALIGRGAAWIIKDFLRPIVNEEFLSVEKSQSGFDAAACFAKQIFLLDFGRQAGINSLNGGPSFCVKSKVDRGGAIHRKARKKVIILQK